MHPPDSGSWAAFPGHKPAEQGLSGAVSQPYDVWSKTTTGAQKYDPASCVHVLARGRVWRLSSPVPGPIASRQSEQVPKSNAKYLPLGLTCSTKFTIPKTPPVAVRMTNLSVLVKTIASLASGSVVLPPNQLAPLIE